MDFPYVPANLPLTDRLAKRFLNLPCGQLVSNEDIVEIVASLKFISSNAALISERLSKVEG
jgi:dTDP-4-amino-4,6-dideoxygalactose transaminase